MPEPESDPRCVPRNVFGASISRTHSGRVSSARGLSPIDDETASEPMVHPWYASRTASTVGRPVAVVTSRSARSTASLPLFTRNTVSSGSGASAASRALNSATAA